MYCKYTLGLFFGISFFMTAQFPALSQVKNNCKIVVSNLSLFDFKSKVVEVPWQEVLKKLPSPDTSKLIVIDKKGRQIPIQFETMGTGTIQNLLLQITVGAKSSISFAVRMGKRQTFTSKTYCRYVPERYDDFAWENDKIAFRMYGKALEATTYNAYGIDVWAKRTNKLVIDKWYKSDDYHVDHGEGCDFYGVGYTLGAGNIAPIFNDSIYHSKNYSHYEILDNGPLRSTFKLHYDSWPVGDYSARVIKTIQLDAGEQLNKVKAHFEFDGIDSLPVAIGINEKAGADVKILDSRYGVLGYWLPADSLNGTIGVGVVVPDGKMKMKSASKHLLAIIHAKDNAVLTYYAGACWDKAGEFIKPVDWYAYLQRFSESIQHPLEIGIR